MDLEQIKIEPPVVIKEELEIVKSEYLEVKLENEEKPPVFEEVTLEEKKPSTFGTVKTEEPKIKYPPIYMKKQMEVESKLEHEEKPQTMQEFVSEEKIPSTFGTVIKQDVMGISETHLITCCICGEKRTSEELVQVPKTQKEVFQWSKILGKQLLKNFTITSMVCRSHFNEKFGATSVINPDRINNCMSANGKGKMRCCYCQKFGLSMTSVSKFEPNFNEWVDILGEDFNEHFQRNNYGVICQIHFALKWEGNRPEGLLPVAHSKTTSIKKKSNGKTFCIFCGESKFHCDLTMVTSKPTTLKQWAVILGEDFYKKASAKIATYICRSHFDVEWGRVRPRGLLPCAKRVELLSNEVKEEYLLISDRNSVQIDIEPFVNPFRSIHYVEPNESERMRCCYCRTLGSADSMTPVSQSEPNFDEWVRILGRNFNEHFEKSNYGVICRIHFAVKWEGNRPEGLLPVAHLNAKNKSNEKTLCIFCGEQKSHCELTVVTSNPTTLKQWADILGVEFYKRTLGRIRTFICRSHFDVEWENNRPSGVLPCAKPVKLLSNKLECEPVLIENIQVKSEEPEIDMDSDQESLHLLDNPIKPKYEHQNSEKEIKPEKDSEIFCETPVWMKQEDFSIRPSDLKRIKIEVKEEQE